MAYTRINWQDGESGGTPLSAENLNKMDIQIEQNTSDIASIIESGSNENGNYIKYSDGTMICTKQVTNITIDITTSWGSMYESNYYIPLGSMPQEFTTLYYANASVLSNSWHAIKLRHEQMSNSSFGQIKLGRGASATDVMVEINCIAIGRWK